MSGEVRSSSPCVPVSWGELIDKITILEIKADRIEAEAARKNVAKELASLREVAGEALGGQDWLAERKAALRQVNEALWDVEDKLREKERAQTFDAEFIALARSVYKLNDERAAVKKQINLKLASEFVEEKSYRPY